MTNTVTERRREFTNYLYGLHYGLSSPNPQRVAESRQVLARLRRVFSGDRHEVEAYQYIFPHDPPVAEQDVWLLVAGLFAHHPQPCRGGRRYRSLGASMGELEAVRGPAATRRFTQLLAKDRDALPHHLRQNIRLMATTAISIDYEQLLKDLVVLLGDDYRSDEAHRVRLRWAREYHLPASAKPSGPTSTASEATPEDNGPSSPDNE